VLTFDLIDLLKECDSYRSHKWIAWNVDCFGSDWYETFSNAPNFQVEMSFNQILDYATNVTQTIDGYFMALKPDLKSIPQIKTKEECLEVAVLLIVAFDSDFFEIYTEDEFLLKKIHDKFNDVLVIH
jgi:hypothetical protein